MKSHVKGFTARHPEVPEQMRGTYAGLTTPAVIDYLLALGVTAIELLPVHHFVRDKHLLDREAHQLLGLQFHRLFCTRYALCHVAGPRPARAGI